MADESSLDLDHRGRPHFGEASHFEERLQKILARAGYGSRRACEELIEGGHVTVDGKAVTELGAKADAARAEVRVDGQLVTAEALRYVMLHKPAGYLSHPDPKAGYPEWHALVKTPERLFPVGRLDHDSEGLLLLTNDGELANRLTHPRYEHPKTYLVQVEGIPDPRKVRRLQHGVMLDDGPTAPAEATLLREVPRELVAQDARDDDARPRKRTSWLKVTLHEGRNRQLRRMVGRLGHPALRVIRVGLGPLWMGTLKPGRWRDLTPEELKELKAAAAVEPAPRPPRPGPDGAGQAPPRVGSGRLKRMAKPPKPPLPARIAIDGPSASGKSTIGRLLATELGYLCFDTGVMYRALAALALEKGIPASDEAAMTRLARETRLEVRPPTRRGPAAPIADGRDVTVLADGDDITEALRRPEVERIVSAVSAYPGLRQALVEQQRRIATEGRVVMVGRDIGTVVLPEAELKLYLDATSQERARRRYLERRARGEPVTLEEVQEDMQRRDHFDSNRQHSPLAVAGDAIVLDTTGLNIEEVMARLKALLKSRYAGRGRKNRGA